MWWESILVGAAVLFSVVVIYRSVRGSLSEEGGGCGCCGNGCTGAKKVPLPPSGDE